MSKRVKGESVAAANPATEQSVKEGVQLWWSDRASSHKFLYDSGSGIRAGRFVDHALLVDPESDKRLLAYLASGSVPDVYRVLNTPYESGALKARWMDYLNRMVRPDKDPLPSGVKKLRALFTSDELVKAGLTAVTADWQQLIHMAVECKSLQGRNAF